MNLASNIDILNKWAEYSEYESNQTRFNLSSYEAHRVGKLAESALQTIDSTGTLSVLLLKSYFMQMLKGATVSVYDMLADSDKLDNRLSEEREMYNMFNSSIVQESTEHMYRLLASIYKDIIGVELIADNEQKDTEYIFVDRLEHVVSDINRLSYDIFKKSDKPIKLDKFCKDLLLFDSLGEALLKLDRSPEGVYMAFINVMNGSNSCYFSIFVKSNGNLIGLSDRIDEAYPGQHIKLNYRNGRWSENKAYILFPYSSMLDSESVCEKGCALRFKLLDEGMLKDDNKIPFKNLKIDEGYKFIALGLLLLKFKYDNTMVEGDIAYVDSLVNNNVLGIDGTKFELAEYKESELLVLNNSVLSRLEVNTSEIINYTDSEYARLFGYGYEASESTEISYFKNAHAFVPEAVGSLEKLKSFVVYKEREKLAHIIQDNMKAVYKDKYNNNMTNWFIKFIRSHKTNIMAYCLSESNPAKTKDYSIIRCSGNGYPEDGWVSSKMCLNTLNDNGKAICDITGSVCSIFYVVEILSANGFRVLGCTDEVFEPLIECWTKHSGYKGNALLDMVDPLYSVVHPFNDFGGDKFKFYFGLSKRGYNKIKKK